MNNSVLLRTTHSLCPVCYKKIPAKMILKGDKIFFEKKCPEHGDCSFVLTSQVDYLSSLIEAYYHIVSQDMPVKILELCVTSQCSLNCPICSVKEAIGQQVQDLTIEDIEKILKDHPQKEILLWGMEAVESDHFEDIVKFLKSKKKKPLLFTNGQKITDYAYLKKLKNIGIHHVYLQFDGFDEETYKILRDAPLLENKKIVLKHLKQLQISTTLNVTLAKGLNEKQIPAIIDYAVKNGDFIRQIGFLPLTKIGGAENMRQDMFPELFEFLQIIERETQGKISLVHLRQFQKLMYVAYRLFRFRRCFWFTLYVLVRNRDGRGYEPIAKYMNLKKVEEHIDQYVKDIKRNIWRFYADIKLLSKLFFCVVNRQTLSLSFSAVKFFIFGRRLEDARANKRMLFLSCADFCDAYKMDLDMTDHYCEELLAIKDMNGKIQYGEPYKIFTKEIKGLNCKKYE